jgi:hypothetical protein
LKIRSRALICSSEAFSSTTMPTSMFPAEMFDGKWFIRPTSRPERSTSSRFPSAMWKTPAPKHWSSGPVGFPST